MHHYEEEAYFNHDSNEEVDQQVNSSNINDSRPNAESAIEVIDTLTPSYRQVGKRDSR